MDACPVGWRSRAAAGENDVTPFVAEDGQVVIAWYESRTLRGRAARIPADLSRWAVLPAAAPVQARTDPREGRNRPRGSADRSEPRAQRHPDPRPVTDDHLSARATNASQTTDFTPTLVKVAISRAATPLRAPRPYPKPGRRRPACGQFAGRAGALVTWVREEPPYDDLRYRNRSPTNEHRPGTPRRPSKWLVNTARSQPCQLSTGEHLARQPNRTLDRRVDQSPRRRGDHWRSWHGV